MTARTVTPHDVINFWFLQAGPTTWYKVSAQFDARVRRLFARAVEKQARAYEAGHHAWLDDAEGSLALIILFDQMSRNIWRGSGRAFAYDSLARDVAHRMIERGFDWVVPEERRAFVYMPFMHSEKLDDQDRCVELAKERLSEMGTHAHAVKHRAVIEEFGRFPYRNDALGRRYTPEERAYLSGGGYAPGRNDSAKKNPGKS